MSSEKLSNALSELIKRQRNVFTKMRIGKNYKNKQKLTIT